MFCKVFLKKFLAILDKVLIFKVFRVKSFFKVFFWKSGAWGLWGIWGVFLFGLPFPWLPTRVSIHLRLASDDSPIFLRSFFDRRTERERRLNGGSTENERRMNGEWTENERRTNGERTENERRTIENDREPNGGWTEDDRSLNGARTELERRINGARTELERSSNGARTELERSLNGGWTEVERRINGGSTEDQRRMNGERSKTEWRANGGVDALSQAFCVPSVWYRNAFGIVVRQNGACFSKLTSAKLQREKAKSKFSANLWCFESAERWKYKTNPLAELI